MKISILCALVLICLIKLTLAESVSNGTGSTTSTGNVESRGLISSIGGGIHEKLRKFVTTVKDILLGHHKKIGGFHFRMKDCFEKIIALEKKLLSIKSESSSCPDIGSLVDKVKEKLYSHDYAVNPYDVQSMAAYLQGHLKTLDARLQQESHYLNLAFEHIKYLQSHSPAPPAPHYKPVYKPPVASNYNPSIKMRDGNINTNQ